MNLNMELLRRRVADDEGFSLVEVIVAITMAAVLLTGGAHALGSSLKAAVFARNNTQAAELLTETIERLRSLDYGALAMVATDLTGDAEITGTAPALTFDPDASGPLPAEPIVLASTGAVRPHVASHVRNSQSYDVRTYVTAPSDAEVPGSGYKRITVRATWTTGSGPHQRQSSTVVTRTRRGLPLPNFLVTATAGEPTAPVVVNTGVDLVLPFEVVNRGARDAFNLAITSDPAIDASFDLFTDPTSVGTHEDSDPPAPDSDSNTVADTGLLEVDQGVSMLAVATVPSTAVSGRYTFTVTGSSASQPTAGGATRTATFTVDVVGDVSCVGCTYHAFHLRNQWPPCDLQPCDSVAQPAMPLRVEAPTAPSLGNFDTNLDNGPGRRVQRALNTPASTTTTTNLAATWRYPAAQKLTINGDLILDLRVAVAGPDTVPGSLVPAGVRVYVSRSVNGSGATELIGQGTASYGSLGTADFHPLRVTVPIANVTVANNRFLEIKVVVDSATSGDDIWLGYDATNRASIVYLPVA